MPQKTCETCVARHATSCRVTGNASLPNSVRWLALEHLNARQEGKHEDCFSWVERKPSQPET